MTRANIRLFEQTIRQIKVHIFSSVELKHIFGWSKTAITFLLHRYAKKGIVVRLKRDLYTLADAQVPEFLIANRLMEPSYVSLESALSFHRVIPETVYAITSVTTSKSKQVLAVGKDFEYHHVVLRGYTGYSAKQLNGITVLIADPEKAIVDYYYLVVHGRRQPLDLSRVRLSVLRPDKLSAYAKLYGDLRLIRHVEHIMSVMNKTL